MENINEYTAMDNTLAAISGKFVSLSAREKAENNKILRQLLKEIIEVCKQSNSLFYDLYREPYYGGSYYEGLKIKKPDEYDIHIKLHIPATCKYQIVSSNESGYVHLKFTNIKNNSPKLWNKRRGVRRPYYGLYGLHALINENGYLDTEKVMLWMHKILSTWLGGKKRKRTRTANKETILGLLKLRLQRHGPAFTFQVSSVTKGVSLFDFDFVPCFVFEDNQWPQGFRPNPTEKSEFYIIPKPLKDADNGTIYLRTSFQEQDRAILSSKERLKPALKLIKKLRDNLEMEQTIVSFFIKNMFLWEVSRRKEEFWNSPLSYTFIKMLESLQRCIQEEEIPYYWHDNFNLLEHIDTKTLQTVSNQLKYVIIGIKKNIHNQKFIAKYFLTEFELNQFQREMMLTGK